MFNPATLQAAGGQTVTGEMSYNDVGELRKALEAGYGTDVSTLTAGGALRIQSLEKTMLSTIQDNSHFKLFNALAKTNATATVDEWTEQSSVGGFLGGSTNTETGVIAQAQGQYNRRVGFVKYLMTRREVSFVTTLQNAIADAEATEAQNGALELLTNAEFLCFEGDSTVVPTEFDGIYAQMAAGVAAGQVASDNLVNADGSPLNSIDLVDRAAAQVSAMDNYGMPTHIFTSQLVQSDFNTHLDPAFRVALDKSPASIMLGSPVRGITTSWGDITNVPDVFVRDELKQKPFSVLYPAIAAANIGLQPQGVAVAASADGTGVSKFTAARGGNYYYYVAGVNAAGESTGVTSSQVAVSGGNKVTITITPSAGGQETGYAIYRSRQNGTSAASDVRLLARIPKTPTSTVFIDYNLLIPGTTKAYILNMAPGKQAITWRQLLPMLKFPLYPTVSATIPWAQLMFGYLRIAKRRQHAIITNIVPTGAVWRPHG